MSLFVLVCGKVNMGITYGNKVFFLHHFFEIKNYSSGKQKFIIRRADESPKNYATDYGIKTQVSHPSEIHCHHT